MTCHDCLERIDELDEGRLSPDEATAVRQHLDICPACRRKLLALNQGKTLGR